MFYGDNSLAAHVLVTDQLVQVTLERQMLFGVAMVSSRVLTIYCPATHSTKNKVIRVLRATMP